MGTSSTTEPKVGDIVVYVGEPVPFETQIWRDRRENQTQFLVTAVLSGEWSPSDGDEPVVCLHAAGKPSTGDQCYVWPSEVRVVRRASYEDAAS
jgi:hypothetical protein